MVNSALLSRATAADDAPVVYNASNADLISRPLKETPTRGHPLLLELAGEEQPDAAVFQQPTFSFLDRYGIKMAGWLEQGFTANPSSPADRSNLPVIFNDRANDYQLNQFWIHAGRPVRSDGRGFDIGGRVDLTYGTDSHFTTSHGLENSWNSPNSNMQLAMPQLYAEVALKRFSMIFGHYLTPIGYEYTPAAPNFFYSHSYNFNFEPGTFTGTLATYRISDQLQLSAGFQRGAQTWTPRYADNDRLGVVSAGQWSSRDKRAIVQFAMSSNRLGPAGVYRNNTYALVVQYHISRRLHYVFEQAGWQQVGRMSAADTLCEDVDFRYGTCQYLFYKINDCWKAGARFSWNGYYQMQRSAADGARQVSNYNIYSATFGLNWCPCQTVVVRPEIRIDWSDAARFDDHSETDQLLLAVDAILKF